MGYTVVWFKRDLRVHDHAPLARAAAHGPALCLYVLEPSLRAQPDSALQHYQFLRESLRDRAQQLLGCGARLQLAVGEVPEVLARLHALQPFARPLSHEETGNGATYARDLAVARWCRRLGVAWQEWPQHGVVRRLPSREQARPVAGAYAGTLPACRRRCRRACDPFPYRGATPGPRPRPWDWLTPTTRPSASAAGARRASRCCMIFCTRAQPFTAAASRRR